MPEEFLLQHMPGKTWFILIGSTKLNSATLEANSKTKYSVDKQELQIQSVKTNNIIRQRIANKVWEMRHKWLKQCSWDLGPNPPPFRFLVSVIHKAQIQYFSMRKSRWLMTSFWNASNCASNKA